MFRLKFERSQRAKNETSVTQSNEAAGYNGAGGNGQPVTGKMDATEARMVAEARATLASQPTPPKTHAQQPPIHDVSQSSSFFCPLQSSPGTPVPIQLLSLPTHILNVAQSMGGEDMDEDVEMPPEPVIKIVRDYKRPEERRAQAMESTKYAISPITGERIPVDKMAEHIRISLIDPKWKEQKEAMLSKVRVFGFECHSTRIWGGAT